MMDVAAAVKVLSEMDDSFKLTADGFLCGYNYVSFGVVEKPKVALDGMFTTEQLKAIVCLMEDGNG